MKEEQSLIYIPDISGFTEFVNETEVKHSQHIISELLEIIIDSNELGLTVSEIEGDAVLFYKKDTPQLEDIIKQSKNTFKKFHEHLEKYNSQRICNCGACSSASGLSLKFIAHAGQVNMLKVKDFEKPHGAPVILAHRLLKNDVDSNEYLLVSSDVEADEIKDEKAASLNWQSNKSKYEDIGEVAYQYADLGDLKNDIPKQKGIIYGYRSDNPQTQEIYIDSPPDKVFEILINFDFRMEWSKGPRSLKYDKDKINRLGTKHTCVIGKNDVQLETITNDFGEEKLVYGERVISPPIVKEIVNYFILEANGKGTTLTLESHIQPKGFISKLFVPLIKKKFSKTAGENLQSLKQLCESEGQSEI